MFTTVDTQCAAERTKRQLKVIAKECANKGMLLYNPENLKGKYSFIYMYIWLGLYLTSTV
jgi:hypothetical protein